MRLSISTTMNLRSISIIGNGCNRLACVMGYIGFEAGESLAAPAAKLAQVLAWSVAQPWKPQLSLANVPATYLVATDLEDASASADQTCRKVDLSTFVTSLAHPNWHLGQGTGSTNFRFITHG